ncbi:uncharacterized protein LOC119672745 [Teleopsis dalmanni]|uniref:uncharacterized protein LOC119669387 n=1 Tax=Teleopsis dalmanni TaxID=139649 RepID=UPI000D32A5A8|nr:uncharacterized protein LOC119669387 [Teleopsis dalmanni]XP_037935182.1 uncharacterized protein LOC119669387 [Teleopsis dalmanni]XP_037935183.1 uncharacterized protein LOC119669387 [Teleopsis dalmanni]XP_037935184.1 uncharacterized protein LOC119669387 [Teleopsis dalmanni]XP_037935185.1 uncharacterized protein LOC119669387 [Teleopsis dalmanni]XP_037935186.1 uncharacterized protein LOC119669387 [Teleopsis dalmanni]XP_037939790.1 uncharacterized protein LOC119672745 [Teleopsis dalmanni]XP_0
MRSGKKLKAVEAKKTRLCVVRLPDIRQTTNRKVNSTPNSVKLTPTDDKKFKGPLKKRPISDISTPKTSASIMPPKSKNKPGRPSLKNIVIDSPPPTIAAGRSRRAIKPNPKYASDDLVTPKLIKNVALLGASASKKTTPSEKQRKESSSSDDFFNKESDTDEIINLDKEVKIIDKSRDSDEDFMEIEEEPVIQPKRRGRPRKVDKVQTPRLSQSVKVGQISRNTPVNKSTPSQLQQLRKTFASSVKRISETNLKRALESTEESDNDSVSTRKKLLLSAGMTLTKFKTIEKEEKKEPQLKQSFLQSRKSLNLNAINNNKSVNKLSSIQQHALAIQEKRKMLEKTINKTNLTPPSSDLQLNQISANKTLNLLKASAEKRRSSSPSSKNLLDKRSKEEDKLYVVEPSSANKPKEAMPTFTIVNINDIINKKGDVLISQTDANVTTKVSKDESPSTSSTKSTVTSSIRGRRKALHTTIRSEKADSDNDVTPATNTPNNQKKATKTILNHTLNKKILTRTNAQNSAAKPAPVEKPAPRILNSVVAKKMQPVRPMIANPDDSADESFPLSLGDEEEFEDDLDIDKPQYHNKKTIPTKENLSAINNRLPQKMAQKTTPEKVVISRHGDKIIKKITCFETWYVINPPEERAPVTIRNQFEIPMIKLANKASEVLLPSDSWSYKVTLCELAPSVIMKSNLTTYTGDLSAQNIPEEDRARYQPSCVMFRRSVNDRLKSRLPFDRAVIFKNKTFFTNIEGKNVKLIGAPTTIRDLSEVETLLEIVDLLTLGSDLVETATTMQ